MTEFKSEQLTIAVHSALRTAASLSSGSLVYPYSANAKWAERRAKRGARPLQWLLERETFERAVATQYAELQNGVVRELVAGTGVGKTTVLPFVIARNYQVNGLVLMPDPSYALRTVEYVKRRLASEGGDVRAELLRSVHVRSPAQAPVVYFSDADSLLGRMACNVNLLRDLAIDFIFLDESHSPTPGYKFFEYLVSAGVIDNCKVFYGTATASADTNMESGSAGRTVVAVKPEVMSADNSRGVTEASPLFHRNIQSRTMVVLSTDQEVISWFKYYDEHDIPVYKCLLALGLKLENGIDSFLERFNPCVLLVTGKFRTSVTLNIDTVVDCGYELKVISDFHGSAVSLKRVAITEALRTQSMGRVGRFKSGRGFYADVECTPTPRELDDDTAWYLFLWSVVFNLRINDPVISKFAGLFSTPLTRIAAAHLLHVRMPPLLMLPYVGDMGFFRGWHEVAKYVLFSHGGVDACDDAPVDTSTWTEYTTGAVEYASVPVVFRSAVRFPREWNVLPAFAWAMHQGHTPSIGLLRSGSVISAVGTVRTEQPRNVSRESLNTVSSHDTTLWTGGRSAVESATAIREPVRQPEVMSQFRRNSVTSALIEPKIPTIAQVQQAYSVRDTIPDVSQVVRSHVRSNSVEEVPRDMSVINWQQGTRVPSMYRVGSDSSDDHTALELRQANPVKRKYLKLYPMDRQLFEEFIASEAATRRDRGRVEKLLNASENIGNMKGDAESRKEKQAKYFLSTIRVHNSALVQKFQLAANYDSTFVAKAQMMFNGDEQATARQIDRTAKLLEAFALENYYVGIDKRSKRSSVSGSVCSPDYDYDEARARVMLSFGPTRVYETLCNMLKHALPYFVDDKYVANAWQFGVSVLTVQHALEGNDSLPSWAKALKHVASEDDVAVYEAVSSKVANFVMRDATKKESVYALTYDKTQGSAVILGDYTLYPSTDISYVDTVFANGASGALLVAVSDGAILGMYESYFGVISNEKVSLVVPSSKFKDLL